MAINFFVFYHLYAKLKHKRQMAVSFRVGNSLKMRLLIMVFIPSSLAEQVLRLLYCFTNLFACLSNGENCASHKASSALINIVSASIEILSP